MSAKGFLWSQWIKSVFEKKGMMSVQERNNSTAHTLNYATKLRINVDI